MIEAYTEHSYVGLVEKLKKCPKEVFTSWGSPIKRVAAEFLKGKPNPEDRSWEDYSSYELHSEANVNYNLSRQEISKIPKDCYLKDLLDEEHIRAFSLPDGECKVYDEKEYRKYYRHA